MKDVILEKVRHMGEELRLNLTKIDTTRKRMQALEKYVTVFHPHLIAWVSVMQNSCTTEEGIHIAQSKIIYDLNGRHNVILLGFMDQLNIKPNHNVYDNLYSKCIAEIDTLMSDAVSESNGVYPSTVMYLFEELSKIFIPWMENVVISYQATDLAYTQDFFDLSKEHSIRVLDAVLAEIEKTPNGGFTRVTYALHSVEKLFMEIFS